MAGTALESSIRDHTAAPLAADVALNAHGDLRSLVRLPSLSRLQRGKARQYEVMRRGSRRRFGDTGGLRRSFRPFQVFVYWSCFCRPQPILAVRIFLQRIVIARPRCRYPSL
jgi:hypothetical protein